MNSTEDTNEFSNEIPEEKEGPSKEVVEKLKNAIVEFNENAKIGGRTYKAEEYRGPSNDGPEGPIGIAGHQGTEGVVGIPSISTLRPKGKHQEMDANEVIVLNPGEDFDPDNLQIEKFDKAGEVSPTAFANFFERNHKDRRAMAKMLGQYEPAHKMKSEDWFNRVKRACEVGRQIGNMNSQKVQNSLAKQSDAAISKELEYLVDRYGEERGATMLEKGLDAKDDRAVELEQRRKRRIAEGRPKKGDIPRSLRRKGK